MGWLGSGTASKNSWILLILGRISDIFVSFHVPGRGRESPGQLVSEGDGSVLVKVLRRACVLYLEAKEALKYFSADCGGFLC